MPGGDLAAYLVVRAEVPEPELRPPFDEWYAREHLRDAVAGLRAVRAWRGWSRTQPSVHFAFYEFPDAERAQAALDGPEMVTLRAEFDRVWGTRILRTRDIIELAGCIA